MLTVTQEDVDSGSVGVGGHTSLITTHDATGLTLQVAHLVESVIDGPIVWVVRRLMRQRRPVGHGKAVMMLTAVKICALHCTLPLAAPRTATAIFGSRIASSRRNNRVGHLPLFGRAESVNVSKAQRVEKSGFVDP